MGVRVSCRGRNSPPNSYRFRCRFGPGADFGGDFGAPLSVEEGERTGHRLPLLSPLPWGRGANRAPTLPTYFRYRGDRLRNEHRTYPLFSPPWGRAPTVPEVHLSTEKAPYPLSHVPYSRRYPGTSPLLRAPPVHPPLLPAQSAPPPRAPCGRGGSGSTPDPPDLSPPFPVMERGHRLVLE